MQVNKIKYLLNNSIKKEALLFKTYKLCQVQEQKYGHQIIKKYSKKHKC